MTSNHYDVVIIGAGPAGSSCATMLARAGMKVLVCDKAKFPREKICGDCINPKSWQLFEILGITKEIHSQSLSIIESIKITNSKGQTIESRPSTKPNAPFFAMKRSELDALLLRNAESASAFVREETQVTDVRRENRWKVFIQQKGARTSTTLTADILVGADGRNSVVAQKLNGDNRKTLPKQTRDCHSRKSGSPVLLRFLDSGFRRNDIKNVFQYGVKLTRVGIQWHTHYQPLIGASVEMFFFDSGYGGIVNVSSEHANVALVTHSEIAQLARQNFPAFLQQTLLNNPRAHDLISNLNPIGEVCTAYPINPASHAVQHPSAFLIGDARQTVEPFTGEGVYFALQDGIETAGKVLQLLKKDTPPPVIKSRRRFWVNTIYSPLFQRHSVVEPLIAAGSRMPSIVSLMLRTVFR